MRHVAPILQGLLAEARLQQGIANYGFFSRWEEVVGASLAVSTRPLRVQGDILWVLVDNPTLRHHLTFLVPQLLDRIHQRAPNSRIAQIRFTLNPEVQT